MSANDDIPKTALPVELWEKVASMGIVYWKITTVKLTIDLDYTGDTPVDCSERRSFYLREVAIDAGGRHQVQQHSARGEFAVLSPTHPLCQYDGHGAGDPVWKLHSVMYVADTEHGTEGPAGTVEITTLVGAERIGGGSLKRRRVEPAAGP